MVLNVHTNHKGGGGGGGGGGIFSSYKIFLSYKNTSTHQHKNFFLSSFCCCCPHHHRLEPPQWRPGEGPHAWGFQTTHRHEKHHLTPLPSHLFLKLGPSTYGMKIKKNLHLKLLFGAFLLYLGERNRLSCSSTFSCFCCWEGLLLSHFHSRVPAALSSTGLIYNSTWRVNKNYKLILLISLF